MDVTVLICTYNRPQLLRRCLVALIDGSIEKPEKIVVVNGGGTSSDEIVSTFASRPNCNIESVKTANKNLATSRNIGLPFCTGDIIALTDDDVEVDPEWTRKIKQLHCAHPEAGAVGGKVKGSGARLIDKIADLVVFPFPDKAAYVRTVAGANASYKKEAIENVREYDETLFRGEDVDYNWRLLRAGYKILYDPTLVVSHHHRQSWPGLFNQVFMYGRAYYLVRSKWKDMYSVFPHTLDSVRSFLKLGYFFIGCIAEPLRIIVQVCGITRIWNMFIPLVICHVIWKTGIVVELISTHLKRN